MDLNPLLFQNPVAATRTGEDAGIPLETRFDVVSRCVPGLGAVLAFAG